MKKITVIIAGIFLTVLSYGQSYFKYKYEGDSLYNLKRFKESGLAYNKAFQIRSGNYLHYYSAACSWALAGNQKQAFLYLEKAVDLGLHDKNSVMDDEDLLSLHESKNWSKLLRKIDGAIQSKVALLDTALIAELRMLMAKDQMLRSAYQCIADQFEETSNERRSFNDLMKLQDSLNFLSFERIITVKNWPGIEIVGEEGNRSVWLLLQHGTIQQQLKYLPLLQGSVMRGSSDPEHLAYLVDRIKIRKGELQEYGTQMKMSSDGLYYVLPVKDPDKLNERRELIGLEPIEFVLRQLNSRPRKK